MFKKALLYIPLLIIFFYSYNYVFKKDINKDVAISNIMSYPMADIIKRCQKDYSYSDEDMIILEKELKKYLALSMVKTRDGLGAGMYSKDVDNLWHTFILFTKEYADFCHTHVGHFIHHAPETNTQRSSEQLQEMRKDFQAFIKNYEDTFKEDIHPIWLLDMCIEDD